MDAKFSNTLIYCETEINSVIDELIKEKETIRQSIDGEVGDYYCEAMDTIIDNIKKINKKNHELIIASQSNLL